MVLLHNNVYIIRIEKPTSEEIKIFLEIFDKLANFESQQRFIRGNAVFEKSELPIPEVVKVINWLREKTEE